VESETWRRVELRITLCVEMCVPKTSLCTAVRNLL
jgi:hypothetical protein